MVDLNLKGLLYVAKAALPHLTEGADRGARGGHRPGQHLLRRRPPRARRQRRLQRDQVRRRRLLRGAPPGGHRAPRARLAGRAGRGDTELASHNRPEVLEAMKGRFGEHRAARGRRHRRRDLLHRHPAAPRRDQRDPRAADRARGLAPRPAGLAAPALTAFSHSRRSAARSDARHVSRRHHRRAGRRRRRQLRLHQRLPRHRQRDGDDDRHRGAAAESRGRDRRGPQLRRRLHLALGRRDGRRRDRRIGRDHPGRRPRRADRRDQLEPRDLVVRDPVLLVPRADRRRDRRRPWSPPAPARSRSKGSSRK